SFLRAERGNLAAVRGARRGPGADYDHRQREVRCGRHRGTGGSGDRPRSALAHARAGAGQRSRAAPLPDVAGTGRAGGLPPRAVLVAGSTLRGEDEAVIRAFNRVRRAGSPAMLVIAARHPERFAEVERLCRNEGLMTVRRSQLAIDAEPRADAVVLDTIGELAHVYQIATAVVVGGSHVPARGRDILEPAVHGKPIVFGPYMQNFAEIAETFVSNGAAVQVRSARDLEETMASLMADPVRRARLGAAARALVDANRGAKDKTLAAIANVLPPSGMRGAVVRPFRPV